jgi:carbonic anhydrase
MKTVSIFVALALGLSRFGIAHAADAGGDSQKLIRLLQQSTLALLKEGNARHVDGQSQHPNQDLDRRAALAKNGQEPLATVIACSDSRVPVEQLFDRGAGDIFVIRVAGNVAGVSEMASIEYGVAHLGTPILVVMGHTKCGAVTAVVKGAELHGHLAALAQLIKPAAHKALGEAASPEDAVPIAIQFNVWQQIETLLTESDEVREAVKAGRTQIIGAVYDIATGKVAWLGQHPQFDRIMAAPLTEGVAQLQPAAGANRYEDRGVPAERPDPGRTASPGPVPHPAQAPAAKPEPAHPVAANQHH